MLIWIIILAIVGLLLVIAEALLPGFGIFGISGGIVLILSTVMIGIEYGFMAFLTAVIGLCILVILFVWLAKRRGIYDNIVLKDVLDTKDFDEGILQGLQGKEAITITTIQPYGKVEIEGKQIEVCSEGGYIDKNKKVKIISVKGKTVVVKEM